MCKEVYVDYEYGDLKEVIIGIPNELYPEVNAPWVKESFKTLSLDKKEMAIERAGKTTKEIILENNKSKFELMEEENKKLIDILKSFNVIVHRPELLTKEFVIKNMGEESLRSGYIQQYARDPFVIIGNNIIELATSGPSRKPEIFAYKELFKSKVIKSKNIKWISMPIVPSLTTEKDVYPMLEGGDIIVLGNTILVGTSEKIDIRSNKLGCLWLQNYLGDEYKVIRVKLPKEVLHLDCVLSVPRDKLVILCKEVFIDGVPSCFDGWDIINVTLEEIDGLGINGLPINKDNYILSYNDDYDNIKIKNELEKRNINVFMIYFQNHNKDGGSVRCTSNGILR